LILFYFCRRLKSKTKTEEKQQNQNYSLGKKVSASSPLRRFKRPFKGER